jgi:4-amino-4-deoxy-L-arabinose transferase-like glycosyltransferase
MSTAPGPEPLEAGPGPRLLRPHDRRWLLPLLAVCAFVTLATLWIGADRDQVRNPDEAAYAEQARSLLEDGSLTVGFARHYHVRYPAAIDHPEDFYPPGNGTLLAASWTLFGRSDFASSIPSILLACGIIPLLAYLLARRLHATPPFAFGCAITVLMDPEFRFHAYQGLADLPLCAAVLATLVLALRSDLRSALLAGIALGLGFWFKPTALLFVPGIALALFLADRRPLRRSLSQIAVFGLAMAVIGAPWLVRNQQLYGDPMYSGNKHLTATANDPSFRYTDTRKVYWADPDYDLPKLGSSVERFGVGPVVRRFVSHLQQIVVDHGRSAFGLIFAVAAATMILHRRVFAVLVVIVSFSVALSAVFAVHYRYLMPAFPMVAAVTWTFADRVVRRILHAPGPPLVWSWARSPGRVAILLAILGALPSTAQFARNLALGKRDFAPGTEVPMHQAAAWAGEHLAPEARVMTTEALLFRHNSGLRAVNTPWDRPDAMDAVVEHHGIGYLIVPDSGQFSENTAKFLGPYLDAYRDRWRPHPLSPDTRFRVYVREGADPPR